MVSRRDQIRMSDEEVSAFLEQNRTVHVATHDRGGDIHLTTLWYGMVDGRISFWTYAKSQKVKNLERDPRVTALVESGDAYAELRGVQIQGKAVLARDHDTVMRIAEAMYRRNAERFGDVEYSGGTLDEGARGALEQMSTKRVAITVEPERVISWDHRKLGGVY